MDEERGKTYIWEIPSPGGRPEVQGERHTDDRRESFFTKAGMVTEEAQSS